MQGGGRRGEGPDEITNLGELMPDVARQRIYAADYGKMQIVGCYDSTYHRLIMTLDDEIQFGYLNLEKIV